MCNHISCFKNFTYLSGFLSYRALWSWKNLDWLLPRHAHSKHPGITTTEVLPLPLLCAGFPLVVTVSMQLKKNVKTLHVWKCLDLTFTLLLKPFFFTVLTYLFIHYSPFSFPLAMGMWDVGSLTRDWTQAHCIENAESYPLDNQGSPPLSVLNDSLAWDIILDCLLFLLWPLKI